MADTPRTETDLITNLFQDGQADRAITEQRFRDFILSCALKDTQYGSPATGGFKDLISVLSATATGPAAPTLKLFGPTQKAKQYAFNVGDSVYVAGHMNHDGSINTTAFTHVHWSTSGTDANSVKWEVSCTTAAGHNTANFGADLVVTVEEAAHGTAWRHMITEDVTGHPIYDPDTAVIMTLTRITNGATDNADDVFGLFLDEHFVSDRQATKNRTPNFYA